MKYLYLKDGLTGVVRQFKDDKRGQSKVKGFMKARMYGVDEKGNLEVVGKRWKKATKKEFDAYMKDKKLIEVESTEE